MTLDEKTLQKIIQIQKSTKLDFILKIGDASFTLEDLEITKTTIPVNRPTKRGGVYFSDTSAYKIKTLVTDLSLLPLLSQSMLGPKAEFQELQIKTQTNIDNKLTEITFFVHLTNSMNSTTKIELTTTLIKLELKNI